MNTSVLRGLLIFASGAGTAVLAGNLYDREPITVEQFQERATVLIAEVEALNDYLAVIEPHRVGIYLNPYACAPPTPPRPTHPKFAVDRFALQQASFALATINENFMNEEGAPVYAVERCRPYEKK